MTTDWRKTAKGKTLIAAAESGDTTAMRKLARNLLARNDAVEEARAWLTAAAHAGDCEAWTDLAQLAEQHDGDAAQANQYWHRAVEEGSLRALHRSGTRAYAAGDRDAASVAWRKAAEGGHLASMQALAVLADREGRGSDADCWLEAAADAGDRESAFQLGIRKAHRGDLDGAVDRFNQACQLTVHAAARYHRGLVHAHRGDTALAKADFDEAFERGLDLAPLRLAILEEDLGRMPQARELYNAAVELGIRDPGSREVDAYLGTTPQGRSWARDPEQVGNPGAHTYLGYLLQSQGQHDAARLEFEAAARAGGRLSLEELADQDVARGDVEGARKLLRLAIDRGDLFALLRLASIAQDAGDCAALEECLVMATEKFGAASAAGEAMATFLIARLLLATGHYEAGCAHLELAANQGHPSAARTLATLAAEEGDGRAEGRWLVLAAALGDAEAALDLASAAMESGDHADAEDRLLPLAEEGHWRAMVLLADIYGSRGYPDEADSYYEQARTASQADELVAQGNDAFECGQEEQAYEFWLQAAERGHIPCMLTVAEERLEVGDVDEAQRWYGRAAGAGSEEALDALVSISRG